MVECMCDEMLKRTEYKDSVLTRIQMALSWNCPVHGVVSADFRRVNHTHPPAHTSSFEVTRERKNPWEDRRIRG